MLCLVVRLGGDRYALDIQQVVEVVPLVDIMPVPQAPPAVSGVFTYRGFPVPVVDLCQLTLNRPASPTLSTRIVVVRIPDDRGELHLLGLIAERATETVRRSHSDFARSTIVGGTAPYLGPVAVDGQGLLHWVEVQKILPASLRDALFKESLAS